MSARGTASWVCSWMVIVPLQLAGALLMLRLNGHGKSWDVIFDFKPTINMRIIEDIWEYEPTKMEIINLTNTKREWNQEWLEISPIFCSPTFSKLIFQMYHLCHLSQASWSLVLNKRSVIYVYTCEQQGQQRISQMSYSQSCACLICDFNLEKMSIKSS